MLQATFDTSKLGCKSLYCQKKARKTFLSKALCVATVLMFKQNQNLFVKGFVDHFYYANLHRKTFLSKMV